jgi:pSer/pThr/pTyr-binding forkhead associated (FHA) protein
MESDDRVFPPDVSVKVLDGERQGFVFPVTEKTVTIGRAPECDLVLPDPYVSRKHCQIVFRGDHFTVLDLGSTNRTKVKENPYIQRNLKNGYVMTLGKTRLRFVWENAGEWVREQEAAGLLTRGPHSQDADDSDDSGELDSHPLP